MSRICTFPECPRPHHSDGLCASHIDQRRRGLELRPIRDPQIPPCTYPDCGRPHYGRGLCKSHLAQIHRGAELSPLRPVARKGEQPPCAFDGCGRASSAKGLCRAHWQQQNQGRPLRPLGEYAATRAAAKAARPQSVRVPAVRRPRTPRAPKSKLPKGWERKAPPQRGIGNDRTPMRQQDQIGPVRPLHPAVLAAALDTLAARDAIDLAEMLGLVAA